MSPIGTARCRPGDVVARQGEWAETSRGRTPGKARTVCARCIPAAVVAVASLFATNAVADIIVLKDKTRLVGKVVETRLGRKCAVCSGKGKIACPTCRGSGRGPAGLPCTRCRGRRRIRCESCGGRGRGETEYRIRVKGGIILTVRESQIDSIEPTDVPEEELLAPREAYPVRRKKLPKGDATAELALARWAIENGLLVEAVRHATRAADLDESLAKDAAEVRDAANARREVEAGRALGEALDQLRSGALAEGIKKVKAVRKEHADNPLFTDRARESRWLAEHAPEVVREFGGTLEEITSAASRRARILCKTCRGTGTFACKTCGGSGRGLCTSCKGTGKAWCPECNGTGWRLCIRCGGTGKLGSGRTLTGVVGACPDCRGRGVIACTACKNGRIDCRACAGKGLIPRGCAACGGKGRVACGECMGTGMRKVTRFRWGPVAEYERAAGAAVVVTTGSAHVRFPVWQGIRRGCIITVMRASDLHDGALTRQLGAMLGGEYEYLVACIDNRDGRDQVEVSLAGSGLRLVTGDAEQVEAVRSAGLPGFLEAGRAHDEFRPLFRQMEPTAVLPGVMRNAIGVFPAGTDFRAVESVYWGEADPQQLVRSSVPEEALARIRKTMK